jgi:hypothetical protein
MVWNGLEHSRKAENINAKSQRLAKIAESAMEKAERSVFSIQ